MMKLKCLYKDNGKKRQMTFWVNTPITDEEMRSAFWFRVAMNKDNLKTLDNVDLLDYYLVY